jgi:hypothetical protein
MARFDSKARLSGVPFFLEKKIPNLSLNEQVQFIFPAFNLSPVSGPLFFTGKKNS